MTDATADSLWQKIITKKFNHRCFVCNKIDGGFPQHSAHHMIKRRFHFTRWDIKNGCYLCNEHHQQAESKTEAMEKMLWSILSTCMDRPRLLMTHSMLDYILNNKNPPITRFSKHDMCLIKKYLAKELKNLS